MPRKKAGQITEHFSWDEAASRGVPVPAEYRANARRLAEALEVVRAECGGRPVIILSWYRTPEHNEEVRGAPQSQHLVAAAADFRIPPLDARTVFAVCDRLQRSGAIPPGGLHAYTDRPAERQFVHLDVRGEIRRWKNG